MGTRIVLHPQQNPCHAHFMLDAPLGRARRRDIFGRSSESHVIGGAPQHEWFLTSMVRRRGIDNVTRMVYVHTKPNAEGSNPQSEWPAECRWTGRKSGLSVFCYVPVLLISECPLSSILRAPCRTFRKSFPSPRKAVNRFWTRAATPALRSACHHAAPLVAHRRLPSRLSYIQGQTTRRHPWQSHASPVHTRPQTLGGPARVVLHMTASCGRAWHGF
jgi:hypothetical protein